MPRFQSAFLFLAAALLIACPAMGAFSYPGCPDVADTDFKSVTLFSHALDAPTDEPLKMAFDMDAQGKVDVYFVQRHGLLRKYVGATGKVVNVHRFHPPDQVSDGLLSLALDPGFKDNGWIYLYTTSALDWRVVRYTLRGEVLDSATEKVILKIPSKRSTVHTGGGMSFDWDGNLVVNTADNALEWPSASSFDLRGKILRVKPRPLPDAAAPPAAGPGVTYDIPPGNLFPPGTPKTKTEIFVMGTRNPYTLTLDPVRKGITWGDVGPDMGGETEEHNFTTRPGNFGYPYFAGDNIRLGGAGTADKPVFPAAGDTALSEIPPAIPAINPYRRAIAMTGPVYYYDRNLRSSVKFPPHFDGVWFVSDFGGGYFDAVVLDGKGDRILRKERVLRNIRLDRPLDFQMGPDGALYVVNYAGSRSTTSATGILRIEYTGTCRPEAQVMVGRAAQGRAGMDLVVTDRAILLGAAGPHIVRLLDPMGRLAAFHMGDGPAAYPLAAVGKPGIYWLKASAGGARISRKIVIR